MENLKQPKPMQMSGDQYLNWKKFVNAYKLFLTATDSNAKSAEVRAAVLLHCVGEEVIEIIEVLRVEESDRKDPEKLIEILTNHFKPKQNTSVERHKFNSRVQGYGESFNDFITDLKKIAANCQFDNLREDLIRDRIVCGIKDPRTRDRLLREDNLDLKTAVAICEAAEATYSHIRQLQEKEDRHLEVGAIERRKESKFQTQEQVSRPHVQRPQVQQTRQQGRQDARSTNQRPSKENRLRQGQPEQVQRNQRACKKCNLLHRAGQCPAYGKICHLSQNEPFCCLLQI